MSSGKKRKRDERRRFLPEWTEEFYFIEHEGKPTCLSCGKILAVFKKSNVERHYYSQHPELHNIKGLKRTQKIRDLKEELLNPQDDVTTTTTATSIATTTTASKKAAKVPSDVVLQASYVVSDLIAKKLKPHVEGDFIKECMVAAAQVVCPEEAQNFKNISLSRRSVASRISDMANNITENLRVKFSNFEFYSLALDEVTDKTNASQLTIFVRGVSNEFEVIEELLELKSLKGITTSEDIFYILSEILQENNLSYKNLSGIATDGIPSMTGKVNGLIELIKQEMRKLGLNAENFFTIHCLIHQEHLCAQCSTMTSVMDVVVKCVNFIKTHGLNNKEFEELIKDVEGEQGDLLLGRWLSRGGMIKKFWELRREISSFMYVKNKPVHELENSGWLCDLAFLVDITGYLSELNGKLKGPDQLVTSIVTTITSFEKKLEFWQCQLQQGITIHFPTLESQYPLDTYKYAAECRILLESFSTRFAVVGQRENEFQVFQVPFSINPSQISPEFQLELIELQADNALKARFYDQPLLEFYKSLSKLQYPRLRDHALKIISLFGFGITYTCEQFFSKLNVAKNKLRYSLTDDNLRNQLRVATTKLKPDIKALCANKQIQVSHQRQAQPKASTSNSDNQKSTSE